MKKFRNRKSVKRMMYTFAASAMLAVPSLAVSAAEESSGPDIAGSVKTGFESYILPQVKNICNWVVFPALDVICGIMAVVNGVLAYKHYKRQEEISWGSIIVPGVGLIIASTAPLWLWSITG